MSRRRVCVVTSALPAPGEPMAARAAEMHAAGAEVTLLRAPAFPAETPLPLWQARLPFRLDSAFASDDPADAAFETWLWLRDAPPFDAIHFAAAGGAGYWLTVARRCGLAFPGTPLVCHLADAPTAAPLLHDLRQIERDFLERRSAEGADAVTGPGRPGWALPARRWRGPADDLGDVARRAPAETRAEPPLVSVCIGTHNRAEPLARAVASIEAQSWPRIELIVADDASTAPEARAFLDALEPRLARRGGRLLRNATNLYNGGNRNRAVAEARGEFVLLMDDDNAAFPEEVESFVTAALHSGADVLTCQQQVFAGPGAPPEARMRRPVGFTPIGPNIPQGVFENCLGDANMFVRRDAYLGIGGTDTARAGFEDWEFLLRAALRGLKVECLPVILFRYRVWDSGQILGFDHDALVRSHRRVLETALREVPEALRPALRLAAETRLHRMADRGEGHWGRVGPVSTE